MTPKEKAKEIVNSFWEKALPDAVENDKSVGIKCALICIENILFALDKNDQSDCGYYYTGTPELDESFWMEVKKEIESL